MTVHWKLNVFDLLNLFNLDLATESIFTSLSSNILSTPRWLGGFNMLINDAPLCSQKAPSKVSIFLG